ncbi:hypothetical protein [Phytohabitans kaempferiae]|uniref:Uncharacterized protein n=1 Tax=Phytohabitans kaempferiae TaxID=1620943 RepID=A0ABV6LYB1_9ACTN
MAKPYLPAQPAPRVIHYADPGNPTSGLAPLSNRELAIKRQRDRVLYARWVARQAQIAERDRKVRRFWLGFGIVAGLTVVAVIAGAVVAVASLGLGLILAIPAVLLLLGGLAVGGHKCVTVVQHWH